MSSSLSLGRRGGGAAIGADCGLAGPSAASSILTQASPAYLSCGGEAVYRNTPRCGRSLSSKLIFKLVHKLQLGRGPPAAAARDSLATR